MCFELVKHQIVRHIQRLLCAHHISQPVSQLQYSAGVFCISTHTAHVSSSITILLLLLNYLFTTIAYIKVGCVSLSISRFMFQTASFVRNVSGGSPRCGLMPQYIYMKNIQRQPLVGLVCNRCVDDLNQIRAQIRWSNRWCIVDTDRLCQWMVGLIMTMNAILLDIRLLLVHFDFVRVSRIVCSTHKQDIRQSSSKWKWCVSTFFSFTWTYSVGRCVCMSNWHGFVLK